MPRTLVQSELVRALGFPDRGIQQRSDFTGFNWADVPAILVEMGFMTNPTEDRALATFEMRQRAAIGSAAERSVSSGWLRRGVGRGVRF